MKPDAVQYHPDPRYLRELLKQAELSRSKAARLLGLTRNGLSNYLRDETDPLYRPASYPVQFALECLADNCPFSRRMTP